MWTEEKFDQHEESSADTPGLAVVVIQFHRTVSPSPTRPPSSPRR